MQTKERGSRLYGAMVITLEEGLRVGRVYEVYIDKPGKQLSGISYKSGLWGIDKEMYVGLADIRRFSRDVVIIAARQAGGELPEGMNRNSLRSFRGYKVTTQAGKNIGEVSDVFLDRQDGKIAEILLSENRKLQLDMAEVVIGPDLILIPAGGEAALAPADEESNDFVNRIFGNVAWTETFRDGIDGVRDSLRNSVQPDKMIDSLRSGSARARDTVLRTSQFIQHTIDQMRKRPESDPGPFQEKPEETVEVEVTTERTMGVTDPIKDLGPEDRPAGETMVPPPKKDDPTL